VILGKEDFVSKVKENIGKVQNQEIVKREEIDGFVSPQIIINKVAEYYGVPIQKLKDSGKANLPKKVALCLLYRRSGLTNKEIANLFGGIHYTAVSHSISRIGGNQEILQEVETLEKLIC